MDTVELKKFIGNWGAGFVALVGLFLIYTETTLIGVLLYGGVAHILLLVYLNTVFNEVEMASFLEKVIKERKTKTWLRRQLGRVQIGAYFAAALYVLAIRHRWYLFAVTCAIIILGGLLAKTVLTEIRGSKTALT